MKLCGYCGSKEYNCDCREREVRAPWSLVIALLLAGCAGAPPKVDDARAAVAQVGGGLARARAGMLAVCDERPPLPLLSISQRAKCDDAIDGLDAAIAGYRVARKVLP